MSLFSKYLRDLIANNNLSQAIGLLRAYAEKNNRDIVPITLVLSGEYNQLVERKAIGEKLDRTEINSFINRISTTVELVDPSHKEITGDYDDGVGMKEVADGLYWGQWLAGFPNGQGMVYFPSGQRLSGIWVRGELVVREG